MSFISKLSEIYTQANKHGQVAKIQGPWVQVPKIYICVRRNAYDTV